PNLRGPQPHMGRRYVTASDHCPTRRSAPGASVGDRNSVSPHTPSTHHVAETMNNSRWTAVSRRVAFSSSLTVGATIAVASLLVGIARPATAQERGNPYGEWRYWGADQGSTRFSPLDQVNAENFEQLQVAWVWRGDNYGPQPDF